MIKIKTTNNQSQRQVIKVSHEGDFIYKVKYIDEKETKLYFLWASTPFKTFVTKKERISELYFEQKEIAELYAQHTTGDDKYDYLYIHTNFIGHEQFKKYGKFKVDTSFLTVYFLFDDRYKGSLGYSFRFGDIEYFLKNINSCYKQLKDHIDKYDNGIEIVSSFDVVTLKTIPYEKIKASSDEMEELKKLISQYKEDMDKYQEFLTNLLSR
ncbi:MAG: hypothetical protein [Wendovervirus sonii]|uniref:Uncharacterized protein n=1 Tax=phage Lak_Megaphage_Sonny TaxID=3109229 RepID=A0ABZ0Z4N9_9CAUD|nr:MAG: hypothetical protein [phage Lak_Megaphage_Sonny]